MRRAWVIAAVLAGCAPGEVGEVIADASVDDVAAAPDDLPAPRDLGAPSDNPAVSSDNRAPPSDTPGPADVRMNPDVPSAPADVVYDICGARPDGPGCANVDGADAVVTCAQGRTAAVARCEAGCDVARRQCLSDAIEPCFNDPDGDYCGASIGAASRRDDLYRCRGRRTESIAACANGCDDRMGGADVCRAPPATDPCARAMYGDGAYCGAGIGGDAAVLYQCFGRATRSSERCANGCSVQPPGVPDRCAPAPGRCCLQRPPGNFVRGFSACGAGGSHYGIDLGAPLGTALTALVAGTVMAVATGHPNCPYNSATGTCPSSCVNNFNYVKVRADCGDPRDASRDLIVWYLHVDRLAPGIAAGAHVDAGQAIAYVGNSGCSSGPHLHLEVASVARGGNVGVNTCASFDPARIYC